MQIKEIAKILSKAGITARPKALQCIMTHIEGCKEALKNSSIDAEMQNENNMGAANSDEEFVINLVIQKYQEMKAYGSIKGGQFLEESTVRQILQDTLYLDSINQLKEQQMLKNIQPEFTEKSFKGHKLKAVMDEIMQDSQIDIKDSVLELLNHKVIVLDSFKDIPKPRILGKHIVYETNVEKSLLSDAMSRANFYLTRLKFIEELVLKEDIFQRAKLDNDMTDSNRGMVIDSQGKRRMATSLSTVSGCLGSTGTI